MFSIQAGLCYFLTIISSCLPNVFISPNQGISSRSVFITDGLEGKTDGKVMTCTMSAYMECKRHNVIVESPQYPVYDHVHQAVYWIDTGISSISRFRLRGNDQFTQYWIKLEQHQSGKSPYCSMSIDERMRLLFIGLTKSLMVISIEQKDISLIRLSHEHNVRVVAIDAVNRRLFVAGTKDYGIHVMKYDGSGTRRLHDLTATVKAMAYDAESDTLFYGEGNTMKTLDVVSGAAQVLMTGGAELLDIDLFEGIKYFTSANKIDAILYSPLFANNYSSISYGGGHSTRQKLTLFRIHGCEVGFYGPDCNKNCGQCVNDSICNYVCGTCHAGCELGWSGVMCQTVCRAGFYGDQCHKQCGRCADGADCNTTSGECPAECLAGWSGDRCDIEGCVDGLYGPSCQSRCGRCKNGTTCDQISGVCQSGCTLGWSGDLCLTACALGWHGDGCNYKCGHCANDRSCDSVSGNCSNGCGHGWTGEFCETGCDAYEYGPNCSRTCGQCANNESCDAASGVCFSGCSIGWTGDLCQTSCKAGWYGEFCKEICGYCKAGRTSCDFITGNCTTGCSMGWSGLLCNKACAAGHYGLECRDRCGQCANGASCDASSGVCLSGCSKGRTGDLCDSDCPVGWFGQDCHSKCGNCLLGRSCTPVSGICSNGCTEGWIGNRCQRGCKPGRYGLNCKLKCGQCANDRSCLPTSGVCMFGCADGWTGELCSTVCTMGWYGYECSKRCGYCANGRKCHTDSGICASGCFQGWSGSMCRDGNLSPREIKNMDKVMPLLSSADELTSKKYVAAFKAGLSLQSIILLTIIIGTFVLKRTRTDYTVEPPPEAKKSSSRSISKTVSNPKSF